jgi:hypothetical protein
MATTDEAKNEGPGAVPVEQRQARVKLTDPERLAKGTALANTLREQAAVEESKAQLAKDFSARMKRLEERADTLRRDIEDGCEDRMIDCRVVMDFSRNMVLYRRCDTDEVVDERAMEAHERQAQIDFPDGKPAELEAPPNGSKKGKRARKKKGGDAG